MAVFRHSINLNVNENESYSITIIIGNRQDGTTTFWDFNNNFVTENNHGNINNYFLGLGSHINGKTLRVNTDITDVNPYTNDTIISYFINGNQIYYDTKPVKAANGSNIFITDIIFN